MNQHKDNPEQFSDEEHEERKRNNMIKAKPESDEARQSLMIFPPRPNKQNNPKQVLNQSLRKKQWFQKEEQSLPNVKKCSISDDNAVLVRGKFSTFDEFANELQNVKKLINNTSDTLKLYECSITSLNTETLDPIDVLKTIKFEKCDDNIFKVFVKQTALERIEICGNDCTWNGFPHDIFNEICRNSKNLNHIVLNGTGIGTYFDLDEFPYQIKKLEATMITFNWLVGIQGARVDFLESQKGSLKDSTIHQLPFDFDGGKVLKYIIEEMKLDTFYYGKIPLILNKQSQKIREFTASEIQLTSAIELIKQFKCDKFILNMSNTDVSIEDIENIIQKSSGMFDNLKEFEVIDNNSGLFEAFSELYGNMKGAQKITFRSNDKNVFKIIQQLPTMPQLKVIELTQDIPKGLNYNKFAADFKVTKIADSNEEPPRGNFGGSFGGAAQGDANIPGGNRPQQRNDEDGNNIRRGGAGGGGGGDGGNNESNSVSRSLLGTIKEGNGRQNLLNSTLSVINLPQSITNFYYVHSFGYSRTILVPENVSELETLLNEDLMRCETIRASKNFI